MTDLQDLLQDAEQLTAQIGQEGIGMPKIQRTISQLCEVGRRKLGKINYLMPDSNEVNASILLAGKGIDAPKLTQTIDNLKVPVGMAAPKLVTSESLKIDTDIQSFLKSEKEHALMSTIEQVRRNTMSQIEDAYWTSSEAEWERHKQKILNSLHGTNTEVMNILHETSGMQSYKCTTQMQGRSLMNDIEMAFAKEVYLHNNRLIAKEPLELLDSFTKITRKLNDKNIEETWNMLTYMCDVPKMAIEDVVQKKASVDMQKAFVRQAIKYLKSTFKEYLKNAISKNLELAKIGGIPGTLQLVSAYMRLNSSKYYACFEELFNEQPLWAVVFLCLRCGDFDAAIAVLSKAKKDDVAGYLIELVSNDNHLTPSSENKLKLEYKSKVKRSPDAFKKAVYSYLTRFSNMDDLSEVLDNVDDFLWFNLSAIAFGKETGAPSADYQTYSEFQCKMSIEYGESYFTKARNPFPYLQVLLLTAQFELAVEFLLKFDNMVVHAVHMAIALYEKNLLNLTKSATAQLSFSEASDPKSVKRINLASLLKMYTRKFECTDPREALEYYFFLRDLRTPQNESYFALFISELALETREFELLFGKLEKNGARKPGAIDKFLPETDRIISIVAREVENRGLVEEAIKLYDLCKEQQRVMELCNKLLSQVVSEVNVPNSNRDRLKAMATSIAQRYKIESGRSVLILKSVSNTFYLLTELMYFFDIYHSENWELAYETLNNMDVLPDTADKIESHVKKFSAFSEEIKRNFPDLILATMNIICTLYATLSKASPISYQVSNKIMGTSFGGGSDGGKRSSMAKLKEHARALIKFVGCIPYRLPGDTNARLLQLEVMLN